MKRYFVTSINRSPDAGVMERDLCDIARRIYTNVIVHEDSISRITNYLKLQQDVIIAQKPRRKPVSIGFVHNDITQCAWVEIGTSNIHLTLVQGEVKD